MGREGESESNPIQSKLANNKQFPRRLDRMTQLDVRERERERVCVCIIHAISHPIHPSIHPSMSSSLPAHGVFAYLNRVEGVNDKDNQACLSCVHAFMMIDSTSRPRTTGYSRYSDSLQSIVDTPTVLQSSVYRSQSIDTSRIDIRIKIHRRSCIGHVSKSSRVRLLYRGVSRSGRQ